MKTWWCYDLKNDQISDLNPKELISASEICIAIKKSFQNCGSSLELDISWNVDCILFNNHFLFLFAFEFFDSR